MTPGYLEIEMRHIREYLLSVQKGVQDGSPLKQTARNCLVAMNEAYEKHKQVAEKDPLEDWVDPLEDL